MGADGKSVVNSAFAGGAENDPHNINNNNNNYILFDPPHLDFKEQWVNNVTFLFF